jgi:hypothetical protein
MWINKIAQKLPKLAKYCPIVEKGQNLATNWRKTAKILPKRPNIGKKLSRTTHNYTNCGLVYIRQKAIWVNQAA